MIYGLVRKAAIGFLVRAGVRRVAKRSVGAARQDLETRLPDRVVRAAERLPGDALSAGGAALVAADGAKAVARASRMAASGLATAGSGAHEVARRARAVSGRLGAAREQFASDVLGASETERRSMMSDFQRENRGEEAATDALLDIRAGDDAPLSDVSEPVRPGRRRFVPPLPTAPVNRVQRRYQRATKAWDRPTRRKLGRGH